MFIGFSTRLKKMGGFRLGIGKRVHGWTAILILVFVGMFYLMYWSFLGCLWLMYGICWLCFYLPVKLIVTAVKKRKAKRAGDI